MEDRVLQLYQQGIEVGPDISDFKTEFDFWPKYEGQIEITYGQIYKLNQMTPEIYERCVIIWKVAVKCCLYV